MTMGRSNLKASYLPNPPKPQVLIDAHHYKKVGLLYLGRDGNYRWNSNKGLKRWMRAGRIAVPFNMALKNEAAGIVDPVVFKENWHESGNQICCPA